MKFRIDQNGSLEIKRGDEWETQLCPFLRTEKFRYHCGQWCPHFGDIIRTDALDVSTKASLIFRKGEKLLEICQGKIIKGNLEND